MIKLRAIVAWLFLASMMMGYAENIYFNTVDATDGLADNFVRDVMADSDGYIWFSTINGLSRYDGYRLYNYMPQQNGSANDITMVRESADQTLWMLCAGELYTYSRTTDTWLKDGSTRLEQLGVDGAMKVFYIDDQHNLWVATDAGLYYYDYSVCRLHHIACTNKKTVLHIISKNGTTAIVTTDYRIYRSSAECRRFYDSVQYADRFGLCCVLF